ncbi:MAG: S8 family serine peptidase, partial [Candidatus Sericytochromatia bacterium]|nr:S8 family serine peptidase [Candidatus Tanganyikabacteria bacterium]
AQSYAPLQGTSMAAPVVSGVAALIWSRHKDWSAAQVKEALQKSAKPLGDKEQFGAGLVDAAAAVAP